MKNKKRFLTALNALYLEVPSDIMDDVKHFAMEALDEEYHKGIEDGKEIEKHGSINWIT